MKSLAQITTKSVKETEKFAQQFANKLSGGEVLLLKGDLGAGKTHFVKGLAKGLGIKDVVTSPTFALHNEYHGRLTLNHFDFYRIENSEEVEMTGLNELFYDKNAVSAIEWSERIPELLPTGCITVQIDKTDENVRQITVIQ